MTPIKDTGVIFNLVRYGEGRLIVEFLTEHNGKIKTSAATPKTLTGRKSRKINTDFNLFDFYELSFKPQRTGEFCILSEVARRGHVSMDPGYSNFVRLSFFGELIRRTDGDAETMGALFNLMENLTAKVMEGKDSIDVFAVTFFNFLNISGLSYNYKNCVKCGLETFITENNKLKIRNVRYGLDDPHHLICERCLPGKAFLDADFIRHSFYLDNHQEIIPDLPSAKLAEFLISLVLTVRESFNTELKTMKGLITELKKIAED